MLMAHQDIGIRDDIQPTVSNEAFWLSKERDDFKPDKPEYVIVCVFNDAPCLRPALGVVNGCD